MSQFSGALKIIDLDDFVQPSQECIKPVKIEKKENVDIKEIQIDLNGNYYQINNDGTSNKLQKTKIELSDCLACSGCITSAESVLVNEQSTDEFIKKIQNLGNMVLVVSISPQSRASIAENFNLDLQTTFEKLNTYFKSLGAKHLFGTSWSENLSLLESCYEFVDKYKNNQLPIFTSVCPGWICYAEKTHPEILNKISTVKSAQQIMGSIVKRFLAQRLNVQPSEIFHVTIMPCYDKKLEASREDFEYQDTREVDMVLTTSELQSLVQDKFKDIEKTKLDPLFNNLTKEGKLEINPGGSGGYLEMVFRHAAKTLFNQEISEIKYKQGKNKDMREVTLEIDGKKVLHFVQCYGFRNIQNIVRRYKTNGIHYVEIMACPSGCLNGGGQIKTKEGIKPKDHLEGVDKVFHSIDRKKDIFDEQVKNIYKEFIRGDIYSNSSREIFHTQYHAREKININPLTIKW